MFLLEEAFFVLLEGSISPVWKLCCQLAWGKLHLTEDKQAEEEVGWLDGQADSLSSFLSTGGTYVTFS